MSLHLFDNALAEIVTYAYAQSPAFKQRLDKLGLHPEAIQTAADLAQIPVLTKDDAVALQQASPPLGGMLAVPLEQVSHIFLSPGPLYEPAPNPDDPEWTWAVEVMRQCGFAPGDVVLMSLSYHLVPAGYLFDTALVKLGCTVLPAGTSSSDLQLKLARELGATGYIGTPSYLMGLIQKAEEMGLDWQHDFKLRKATVSAEPLSPALRARLEGYGLAVTNAYGTAEFGILALGKTAGMMMQLLDMPLIQIVDPDTGQEVGSGEVGEVVVTNFSRIYPLIRYGTGDMAINVDPNPGQSRQGERSIILVGRRGEAVKVRGMFVHPNQVRFAAASIPSIRATQVIITRPELRDDVTIRAEVDDGQGSDALAQQLLGAFQAACRVKADRVQFLPPGTIDPQEPGVYDQRQW
ncbi:MAG: AMP-binding protein [Anaerolineae bacterium]|nr:AMP-binding protein [Anaerolineae bacterium]